jgi:hypothetical protein
MAQYTLAQAGDPMAERQPFALLGKSSRELIDGSHSARWTTDRGKPTELNVPIFDYLSKPSS